MGWRLATLLLCSAVAASRIQTPLASRDGHAWKPHYELRYSREAAR